MPEIENEDATKLRKKRPERQLYVPPAQRRSSLKDKVATKERCETLDRKKKLKERNVRDEEKAKKAEEINPAEDESKKSASEKQIESDNKLFSILDFLMCSYVLDSRCKCEITENCFLKFNRNDVLRICLKFREILGDKCRKLVHNSVSQIPIIYLHSSPILTDILENIFLWKLSRDKNHIGCDQNLIPFYTVGTYFQFSSDMLETKAPFCSHILRNIFFDGLDNFRNSCEYDGYLIGNDFCIERSYTKMYVVDFLWEQLLKEKYEHESFAIKGNDMLSDPENAVSSEKTHIKESLIKMSSRGQAEKNVKDPPLNTVNKKSSIKKNGHEEEIEIMRKTKENINRKTKPIMKYVGEINDTLKIEISNVKDWEDLLNDEGEIKEEFLEKSKNKTGKKLNNAKTGNQDAEETKELEEFEHMVELYDFPSSFKTNDLIQAFSNIDSEAMYVKWVDDTHAILVLGSLTQATKAINVANPLVKVRPMSLASKMTLAIASKHDLKPAMKRPQTNLQTARRFITAALGTHIGVSKEKMAKERDDLRIAREMKKMARQNERDAWEGNLKSKIN